MIEKESLPIYPEKLIQLGDNSEYVRHIQRCLNRMARRFPSIGRLEEDGVFGYETLEAVKAFQRAFGLDADGIVGMITWVRLSHECGIESSEISAARLTARQTLGFLVLRSMFR
ncbi:MAG: peptidoglycan-binding protein [Clostridiales bacterium]|nr:peptidoglycan-binding protein [Clostridiales bacterium]